MPAVQDGGADVYSLLMTNGGLLINDIEYPPSGSDRVLPTPTLTFDEYNKLSINDITPTSTSLKYLSNTYDIGAATSVYIEDEGTYDIETKNATTFAPR